MVADEDTDEENTYTIVGPYEADISKSWISTSSPIGNALIGKKVGTRLKSQLLEELKVMKY